MRRREFVKLAGSAVVPWPTATRAQQSAMPVIGFLSSRTPEDSANVTTAFRQGLKETGFAEGQNIAIAFRWADGDYARLPQLAADLVRHQVTVIAAINPQSTRAVMAATTTIPIIFQSGVDPIVAGLVNSLNRPSGNVTGFYRVVSEFVPKCLELVRKVSPNAVSVAVLLNPTSLSNDIQLRNARAATDSLGLRLNVMNASSDREIESAFTSLELQKIDAMVIGSDSFFISRSELLASLALRAAMPTIAASREFTDAGGLMSYDASLVDQYRQVGAYVGRVLKGEKLADLPVQQATKYEMVINLKTAKAIGLTVPALLLATADEVIE
jgi:putative ABC transport system substrate-binding protein